MSDSDSVLQQLLGLVAAELDVRLPVEEIRAHTPLFDGGLGLDSFGVVELITVIEAHFGIQFAEADFAPEHFSTLDKLATLVARHRPVPAEPAGA
jgi:acyl carrier protein